MLVICEHYKTCTENICYFRYNKPKFLDEKFPLKGSCCDNISRIGKNVKLLPITLFQWKIYQIFLNKEGTYEQRKI
jgi:hypothetical protein